jgi:hypothetical protein
VRPEPADLFARLCAAYDAFVDFGGSVADQRTMCELSACLSLVTWLSDAFPLVPYLWLAGERGSGKTQLGTVWARTSYLGTVVLAGSSYAALRDLAQLGAALYVDDAEALAGGRRGDAHKRELLLAGNRRGARVAHKAVIDGRWQTHWTSAYTPRAFSAIAPPEPTLASRAIVISLARTLDATRAHRDPDDLAAWPCDLAALRDDMWAFGLTYLAPAAGAWRELTADPLLVGREFDPWRPVLAVALLLEGASGPAGLESRLRDLMHAHQRERVEQPVQDETLEVVRGLVQAFESLFDQRARNRLGSSAYHSYLSIPTVLIAQAIAVVADLPPASLDRAFTVRLGTLLARLRLKPARMPGTGARGWRVSCARVVDIARSYGIPTTLDRFAPVTSVTSVTPSRG